MSEEGNLHAAVRNNDIHAVRRFMSSGDFSRMIEWSIDDGYSLLLLAIEYEYNEIAKLLLVHGAKIHSPINRHSNTLLYNATANGDIKFIEMLLDRGANVDDTNKQKMTPLHYAACRADQLQIMELLLKNRASVTARCDSGKMPLHYAAASGHLQNVECLLNHGAPINAITGKVNCLLCGSSKEHVDCVGDLYGFTALHYACQFRNEKMITLLLSRGADVNSISYRNLTPLHVSAERKLEKNVKLLLDHGGADINARADNDETVLDIAVKMTDPLTLAHVLKSRPDINQEDRRKILHKALFQPTSKDSTKIVDTLVEYGFTIFSEDANNSNLLIEAVNKGCLKIVKDLVSYGADINHRGVTSLLHIAASHNHIKLAELLIKHGIDVNAKNMSGRTPIFSAIRAVNKNMIKLLLSCGADVKYSDPSGITPLHYLVLSKNLAPDPEDYLPSEEYCACGDPEKECDKKDFILGEIAKLCLSEGASIDAVTDIGLTALHAAAADKNSAVVKVLLEHNADVNLVAVQDGSKTSLHYSAAAGCEVICKMLLEHGAKINVEDKHGITPIHVACHRSYVNVVRVLLNYGADINSRDNKGRTPLCIAATVKCSSKIVKFLLSQGTCEVDLTSKYGITALDSALLQTHSEIIKDLLDYSFDIDSTLEHCQILLNYVREGSQLQAIFDHSDRLHDYEEYQSVEEYNHRRRRIRFFRRTEPSKSLNNFDVHDEFTRTQHFWVNWIYFQQALNIFRQHVVKMSILNPIATKDVFSTITWKDMPMNFPRNCEQEIEKLKRTMIVGSQVSFHDVLTKSMRQLSYAENKSIREELERNNYVSMFPLYSGMIYMRYKKVLYRNHLLNESEYSLNSMARLEIPDLVAIKLLSYLSNKDLKNLIEACFHSQD